MFLANGAWSAGLQPIDQTSSASPSSAINVRAWFDERCQTLAGEQINETIDGVTTLLWRTENGGGLPHAYLMVGAGGVSFSLPHWQFLQLGLHDIEFDAHEPSLSSFGKVDNPANHAFGRFSAHTWNVTFHSVTNSDIHVIFKGISTPEEEKQGLFGRTIYVKNVKTGKILGERTEFFRISRGFRPEGSLCPSISRHYESPSSFISKVINPNLYTCRVKYEKAMLILDKEVDEAFANHDPRTETATEKPGQPDYFLRKFWRRSEELSLELQQCNADYFLNRCDALPGQEMERCVKRSRGGFIICSPSFGVDCSSVRAWK